MKNVKLKICNGLTLAHPLAPLGITPSGSAIFEVTDIPDEVTNTQLILKFQGYLHPIIGKELTVSYGKF